MAARSTPGLTQELIFLDRDDDLASIKAKLESSDADQIFLAIPRRATVLRTPLEFRILARMAHETSSETIIVTPDGERRRLAREEGFRTRRSLNAVRHLMRPSSGSGAWVPALPDLPFPSLGTVFTVAVVLGTLLLLNFYILPVMTVKLVPVTRSIDRELTITVDPGAGSPDPGLAVIPGRVLETTFQVSGSAAVEGTQALGDQKARGEVLLSNTGPPVTLPAGLQVIARNGKRFALDGDVNLPSGARNVRAAVSAVEPGTASNVGPREINALDPSVPRGVSVTNPQPLAGGTDRQGRVVSEQDVARLREQLTQRAREQAARQLQSVAGDTRTVPPHSIDVRVVSEQIDPQPGSEAEQVSGRLVVRTIGTAFENRDFNQMVTDLLLADVPPEMQVVPESSRIGLPEVTGVEGQQVILRVRATAEASARIDTEALAAALSGMSVTQARAALQQIEGLAEPPQIDLWPAWVSRAYRVQVELVPSN